MARVSKKISRELTLSIRKSRKAKLKFEALRKELVKDLSAIRTAATTAVDKLKTKAVALGVKLDAFNALSDSVSALADDYIDLDSFIDDIETVSEEVKDAKQGA